MVVNAYQPAEVFIPVDVQKVTQECIVKLVEYFEYGEDSITELHLFFS